MSISIPTNKQEELLSDLVNNWGPTSSQNHFTLTKAVELLSTLVSMCRVCPWGIFLFQNLYHTMYQSLAHNAARIWHSKEFRDYIALRDTYSKHPGTDSSKYWFFSKKVSRAIWDVKSHTYLSTNVREELAFITKVFSDPSTYCWESPIAHLVKRDHDFDKYQDSCLKGAGGFSPSFRFWWIVEWHDQVVKRTKLPRNNILCISINLLEYTAIIISLVGLIVAWEMLPLESRPSHLMVLLWTDNTTAKTWTKKISGFKTPQGRTLARIFSHLKMFSDVGIEAGYIKREKNTIAYYLSRVCFSNDFCAFLLKKMQTKFSCLKSSRPFLPSRMLVLLLTTALLTQSIVIPTTGGQAQTDSNRADFFENVFLPKLGIEDSIFLKQSLPEVFMIFAMYVVYPGLGHTLLCKTIKSGTISLYVCVTGNRIMDHRQELYSQAFPNANLTWYHACQKHGSTTIAQEIRACILKIKRWENMPNRRKPLTTDMIQYQKLQCSSATPHSLNQALYDWFVTGIYAGFQLSEWAQDDHSAPNHR
jgi:hypothetical protein